MCTSAAHGGVAQQQTYGLTGQSILSYRECTRDAGELGCLCIMIIFVYLCWCLAHALLLSFSLPILVLFPPFDSPDWRILKVALVDLNAWGEELSFLVECSNGDAMRLR